MIPIVRKLSIALAVSVALNLFGLGFGVARGCGARRGHAGRAHAGEELRTPRMRGGHGFGPFAPELDAARRDAMRAHRRAIADAQRAVAAALTAEPFDRTALEASLQTLRAKQAAAGEAAHAALVELAVKLDAPGRRALAERGPGMRGR